MNDDLPPHNRLKLPFLAAMALLGVLFVVLGVLHAAWWLVAIGVAEIGGCAYNATLIHQDRR